MAWRQPANWPIHDVWMNAGLTRTLELQPEIRLGSPTEIGAPHQAAEMAH